MTESGRFPRFPDSYRARWVEAGNWADRTLHDVFDETVTATPDAIALITVDEKVSFAEFKEASDALAAGLLGLGIGHGDLVSVQLPNWKEFCFLQIALSRIGAVIQPMHLVFREREMRSLLEFCESDAVIVPGSFGDFDYVKAIRSMSPDLPRLRTMLVVRDESHTAGGGGIEGLAEQSLEAVIAEGREHLDRLKDVTIDPDDVFYMNFTSGTEGNPKGFMHTHNTLTSLFFRTATLMKMMEPDAVTLACSPMTHSFGHFTTYQTAIAGTPMVLVARYHPLEVLQLLERERVTTISGTPAHLIGILHHPDFKSYDTSAIKSASAGGASSAPELISELEAVWGIKTMNTYGLGENIVHTRTMPFDPPDKVSETVGRALPGTELRIVDPETRADVPAGDVGEITFRGATLFVGYYRQPERTAETRDDDGWFYTGDLGFLDEDGYLHFASRRSEVINRGGSKIYPKEIEDLLGGHPSIEDIAVVGMPDERFGETVLAYVVAKPGETVTLDSLAAYLKAQQVMRYKVPQHLVMLDALPMTPTGKVRKAELKQDAARRAEEGRTTENMEVTR